MFTLLSLNYAKNKLDEFLTTKYIAIFCIKISSKFESFYKKEIVFKDFLKFLNCYKSEI